MQAAWDKALLKERVGEIEDAAMDLGVALWEEVQKHAAQIVARVCLKPLERTRLLAAIGPPPTSADNEEDDDPFGHGCGFDDEWF